MITKQYLQVVAERQKMLSSILKNKFWFYPCFVNKGPAERSQLFNTTYCNIALGNLRNLFARCWIVQQDGQKCATYCVR